MKFYVIFILALFLSGCSESNNPVLDEKIKHWELLLNNNVPSGTSLKSIESWALKNNIQFHKNPTTNKLYANVEAVKDTGMGFPCSHWNVILEIQLNKNKSSISNSVSSVGTCV